MKEASTNYLFDSGLRAWGQQRNTSGLVECYNMVPRVDRSKEKSLGESRRKGRQVRLEAYTPLTLVSSDMVTEITTWPFPQLFCLHSYNLLCDYNKVYLLNSSFVIVDWWNTTASKFWQVADWWKFVLLTNGNTMYVMDPATSTLNYIATGDLNLPMAQAICNFKGQYLAGAVSGYDSNVLVWSEIGGVNLDIGVETPVYGTRPGYDVTYVRTPPSGDDAGLWAMQTTGPHPRNYASPVEAGYMPMPWQGAIKTIKRLGDYVVAYGEGGVAVLQPADITPLVFHLRESLDYGVTAVGGDIHRHLFLTEDSTLWLVSEDLKMKELGYQEWMATMSGTDIKISYDPSLRDFYISNGTVGYILSENGLAKIFQRVSSVAYYRSTRFGTFSSSSTLTMIVCTDVMDMGVRGRKTIGWVEIDYIGG